MAAGSPSSAGRWRPLPEHDAMLTGETLRLFVSSLFLQAGYNTVVVVLGVTALGLAAGLVGAFALLRKRAMMTDVLSHATLPGLAAAWLVATGLGASGRSLPVLLTGAAIAAIVAALTVQWLTRAARLPEDAAMGATLSVFFGLGAVLLSYIQTLRTGSEGGLARFILGQTATMSEQDAYVIATAAVVAIIVAVLLEKEFRIVCFDPQFGAAQGWPVALIDLLLMTIVVGVAVVGLQAVGMILIIALMIIPAATARLWTDRLRVMLALSSLFGAASAWIGASLSAALPKAPAGGLIVLVAGAFFIVSLAVAPSRVRASSAEAQ
jgi:manganese/zinc/iron transport system permease protein